MFQPCCCQNLKWWTKLVAIFKIAVSIVLILSSIMMIMFYIITISRSYKNLNETSLDQYVVKSSKDFNSSEKDAQYFLEAQHRRLLAGIVGKYLLLILGQGLVIICGCVMLIMNIFLLKGAQKDNSRNCKAWLVVECIFTGIGIAMFLFQTMSIALDNFEVTLISLITYCLNLIVILVNFYCMLIVWSFLKEIRTYMKRSSSSNTMKSSTDLVGYLL